MKDPFQKRECAKCVFFVPLGGEKKIGECRKGAPVCTVKAGTLDPEVYTFWPRVYTDDFCGEFQCDLKI